MLARCLHAKYIPRTDFLHVSLCLRPSFAWRSIWEARGLLEEGLQLRVGNGASIKVWNDWWLHELVHFQITLRNLT